MKNFTQQGPDGIRFDFNEGTRVYLPFLGGRQWRLRIKDTACDIQIFDDKVDGGEFSTRKKWFFEPLIEVYKSDVLLFSNKFSLKNRDVLIKFYIGTLGDIIAWFPYAAKFAEKHQCKVTCLMGEDLIPLFKDTHEHMRFISTEHGDDTAYYATYKVMMFWGDSDRDWNHSDSRWLSLQGTASHILGLDQSELKPRIVLSEQSEIEEPYACIATQASGQAKYWNNVNGWSKVIQFLKSIGLRVICIDKNRLEERGYIRNYMPFEAEDCTGNKPLSERANLLQGATVFVGLSSGLSWLAWASGVPVVMISGFTHPKNEFFTPYRVINWNVCNSCWNDDTTSFEAEDRQDFLWCPRHKSSHRMFECSKAITSDQVISTIKRVPAIQKLVEAAVGL